MTETSTFYYSKIVIRGQNVEIDNLLRRFINVIETKRNARMWARVHMSKAGFHIF